MRKRNNRLLSACEQIYKTLNLTEFGHKPALNTEDWELIEFLMEWGSIFFRDRERIFDDDDGYRAGIISKIFALLRLHRAYPDPETYTFRGTWFVFIRNVALRRDIQLRDLPRMVRSLFWAAFMRGNSEKLFIEISAAGNSHLHSPPVGANRIEVRRRCGSEIMCNRCGRFIPYTSNSVFLGSSPTRLYLTQSNLQELGFENLDAEYGIPLCSDCTEEFFCHDERSSCNVCGMTLCNGTVIDGETYCRYHAAEHQAPPRPTLYRTSRPLVFYPDRSQHRYYGIETEIENIGSTDEKEGFCREIEARFPKFFSYKNDGSLSRGLEFNSMPATLDFLRENRGKLKDVLEYAFSSGHSGYHSRCGMHIHISRASFRNTCHMHNFQLFFDGNYDFSRLISGRSDGSIEEWATIRDVPQDARRTSQSLTDYCYDCMDEEDRYNAVNYCSLQTHDTLEVRLFKGTLFLDKWLGRVELVNAVIEVTEPLNERTIIEPQKVIDYLVDNHYDNGAYVARLGMRQYA